ncbi:MAG TPA: hypothetical protein VMQ51_20905 [Candidatus Binatia bacterium]|nr:hypothetical protein [Candidatus Binatia bacterium]
MWAWLALAVALAGCAPQLNPIQTMIYDAAKSCEVSAGGGRLTQVWPDGRYEITGGSSLMKLRYCMDEYFQAHCRREADQIVCVDADGKEQRVRPAR